MNASFNNNSPRSRLDRVEATPAINDSSLITHHSSLTTLLLAFSVCIVGCNREGTGVKQARDLLPLGKPQEALDKLGSDKTPEACYLRSVSLYRLNLREAAVEELHQALRQKPDDSKYLGFQLLLQSQGNEVTGGAEEVDRIIQLYEANKSSPALSLFATTAYARRGNAQAALEAFRTAVALSEAIPELMPEMLAFAVRAQLAAEAKTVLDKLDKLGAGDKPLAKQRVATLLLLKQTDDALRLAKPIYVEEQTEDAALLYAQALAQSSANAERDQTMQSLRTRFLGSRDLLTLHCGYLVRSGRLDAALTELDGEISRTTAKADRQQLVLLAIGFPLEAGNADEAERQLVKYHVQLTDPSLIEFYEARIAHARRDFATAATRLSHVIQVTQDKPEAAALTREAALWLEIVRSDQRIAEQLKKTAAEPTQPETETKQP